MRLSREQLGPDPMHALTAWIAETREAGLGDEPLSTLATVDETGAPDARLVVVRGFDDRVLTYYADSRSPKGRHVARNPRASLVLYWPEFARQVRIRGEVTIAPEAESDAAFASRERHSQIGYWTNEQSAPIADRAALEARQDAMVARFNIEPLTRPPHWVVYRLAPWHLEFWQSGERHLHDRIAYTRSDDGSWNVVRLQP